MARLNRCRSDLCTLDHLYFSCNKERPKKASAFLLSLFCCDQKNLQTIVFTGGAKFRPIRPPPPPIKFSAVLHTCQVCMHCRLTNHINWQFIFHSVEHLDSDLFIFFFLKDTSAQRTLNLLVIIGTMTAKNRQSSADYLES